MSRSLVNSIGAPVRGRSSINRSVARRVELGVSQRQIQKLEAGLFALGAIGFQDSPNHKRYGVRDPNTGRLKFGYGVDLSPLALFREDLEAQLAAKQQAQQAWLAAKRSIGETRRQIRGLLAEGWQREEGASPLLARFAAEYASIAGPLRTHHSLAQLQGSLEQHQQLQRDLLAALEVEMAAPSSLTTEEGDRKQKTCGGSSTDEQMFAHSQFTNPLPESDCSHEVTGGQESGMAPQALTSPTESAGLIHITLDMALSAASSEFATLLPIAPDWNNLVAAASRRGQELGVTPKLWGEACRVLGWTGAALCVLVTDRKRSHPTNPVQRPAAYFRGLVRAGSGGSCGWSGRCLGCWSSPGCRCLWGPRRPGWSPTNTRGGGKSVVKMGGCDEGFTRA